MINLKSWNLVRFWRCGTAAKLRWHASECQVIEVVSSTQSIGEIQPPFIGVSGSLRSKARLW